MQTKEMPYMDICWMNGIHWLAGWDIHLYIEKKKKDMLFSDNVNGDDDDDGGGGGGGCDVSGSLQIMRA
uniref:Uncharacterized protein n=1 Tax=Glossina pallidipes TaxID=7398 RepID=A0A1B0A935_GLOPL